MACAWGCFKGNPRQSVCSQELGDSFDVDTWEAACGHRTGTLKCGGVPVGQGRSPAVPSAMYISSPLSPHECGCLDRDRIKSSITEQEFGQQRHSY